MESVIDFLRRKGILNDDATKWIVKFEDGREFDIVALMNEYIQLSERTKTYTEITKEFMALRARRGMILSDLADDEIENSMKFYNRDIERFFENNPGWKTIYTVEFLSFPTEAMRRL